MGNTLYWKTIPLEPIEEGIDALRHTLAKKVFKDGLDFGETVDKNLIPFLEGIVEGNGSGDMARDAQKLINAIKRYGKVNLSIHA